MTQLQSFIQRLALHLTGWQAMTFLVGEHTDREIHDNPVPEDRYRPAGRPLV